MIISILIIPILLIVAFFTSIILIALGISTMYQAKIYGEVKKLYLRLFMENFTILLIKQKKVKKI